MRMIPSLKAQPPGRFAITSQTGYNYHRRGHVSEKEYTYYFTPERKDRFRYYHHLMRGRIIRFRIQYEALIGERCMLSCDMILPMDDPIRMSSTPMAHKTRWSSMATPGQRC